MKRALAALLLLAGPLWAQDQDQKSAAAFYTYDISNTSFVYGTFQGSQGNPFGAPIQGAGRIKTAGASTTVTENVTGENPFTNVAVGDILQFVLPADAGLGTVTTVLVTARASAASITVGTSVNLTGGVSFKFFKHSAGTAATSGFVGVGGDAKKSWSWTIATINATSIEVQIQCIDNYPGAVAVTIYPNNPSAFTDTCYTGTFTTTKTCKFITETPYGACRWGLKVTGDAGAQSVSAGYQAGK